MKISLDECFFVRVVCHKGSAGYRRFVLCLVPEAALMTSVFFGTWGRHGLAALCAPRRDGNFQNFASVELIN